MALVLDKCFLFSLLASFFKISPLCLHKEGIVRPVAEANTRAAPWSYAKVYPHEKVTLFLVTCQKHTILAQLKLFTFSQCRIVGTITDLLKDWAAYCLMRVCMMCDPLYVLFPFWSRGKHKAHFLRAEHIAKSLRFFYQFQHWKGVRRSKLTR